MNLDRNLDKNILIKLLRTFSVEEWKQFERFCGSSYFNLGRSYSPLLKILKKYYPDFKSPKLTRERVYETLFKGKEYKESVLNSMLSRLFSLAEEFLFQKSVESNESLYKERTIIKELSDRGIYTKASSLISTSANILKNRKRTDDHFLIMKRFNKVVSTFHYDYDERDELFDSVTNTMKYVIYSFMIELFTHDMAFYTQKHFWKSDYKKSYLNKIIEQINIEEILKIVKEKDTEDHPYIYLFYLVRMSLKFPDKDYYTEAKKLVYDNFPAMDKSFKKFSLNLLALICSMKLINGKREFRREGFEIRKKSVEENLFSLTTASYFKNSEFRSTFLEALNVNQVDWAEEFSQKYCSRLHPDFRTDIGNYCKARIAYERGNYSEAVDFAAKVNISQITFALDMKNLLSKIYFDTNSIEPLYSLLSAYYQLIKKSRSRNSEIMTRHSNFVKSLRKLLNISLKGKDDTELKILRDEVEKMNVTSKSWLFKKIEQANIRNS